MPYLVTDWITRDNIKVVRIPTPHTGNQVNPGRNSRTSQCQLTNPYLFYTVFQCSLTLNAPLWTSYSLNHIHLVIMPSRSGWWSHAVNCCRLSNRRAQARSDGKQKIYFLATSKYCAFDPFDPFALITSGPFLANFNSKEEIPARTNIRTWYIGDPERYGEDTGTEAVGAVRQLVQGQQPPSWLPLIRRSLAILGNTW